jgi:hypothetical protein
MSHADTERKTFDPRQEVLNLSDEKIESNLSGIRAATTRAEAQHEQMSFEQIAKLFLDDHVEKKGRLEHQREVLLDSLMDNVTDSFRGEFLQLELLYEARTSQIDRYDGTTIREFCTQNHERGTADYLFSSQEKTDGTKKYEVKKVFTIFGQPDTVSFAWENDTLAVINHKYERGITHRAEVTGDKRDRLIAQLFVDTIHASAVQFERSADDRETNDQRAKTYLAQVRQNEYALF